MPLPPRFSRRQGAPGAVPPPLGADGSSPDRPSNALEPTPTRSPTITSAVSSVAVRSQSSTASKSRINISGIIAVVITIVTLLLLSISFCILQRIRRKHKNPKYVPTPFLKNLWKKWDPAAKLPRNAEHFEPLSTPQSGQLSSTLTAAGRNDPEAANGAAATGDIGTAGVDRNTSVRSVMTLPAYRPNAYYNEQVLGREGDRGGIDVVVEFPENQNEEETRREEEMEALYQVRLARRRENEERDERRRLRREARERGDLVALRELQARARASSTASAGRSVEELRAEHDRIKKERQRAVSSVSYGDLGVARHDGTRLRANSEDSERQGLLGDAASISASSPYHRRERSASSVLSIDTMNSDHPSPAFARSRGNSRATLTDQLENPLRRLSTQSGIGERAGSSPEIIEHGDGDIPPNSPPGYENISLEDGQPSPQLHQAEPPPDYSSPVVGQGDISPSLEAELERSERLSRRVSGTHTGQGTLESSTSSNGGLSAQTDPPSERRNSRGVGGVPQLPSLRLGSLPSIQVDPGSPHPGNAQAARRNPRS